MSVTVDINGKQVTFGLEKMHNGVCLRATHIDGKDAALGYLLRIRNDGKFERELSVSDGFGFKLNEQRQIKQHKKV